MVSLPPLSPWRPLLQGARQKLALGVVGRIAAQLPAALEERIGPSLGRGTAGAALAFAYLAEVIPDAGHAEVADALLARAIDGLAEVELPAGLYAGYTGVASVYDLVAEGLHGEPPDADALAEVDDALATFLTALPSEVSHAYGGFAGLVVYAVGRGDDASRALLRRLVDLLEARAELTEQGVTWVTTPYMQRRWARGEPAQHHYNLGVSHGVPGAIGALAAMLAAGVEPERTRRMLESAARWLVQQIRPDGPSGLGYHVGDVTRSRLAWCYGDLGVAVVLMWTARVLQDEALFAAARALGIRAAARSEVDSGVLDAGLCHGAAGNAHCFNRLWQHTGDPLFATAANAWIDRTIACGGEAADLRGFAARTPEGKLGEPAAFLEGSVGVMAALAAAAAETEPRWDRVLLLSRPRPNRGAEASS